MTRDEAKAALIRQAESPPNSPSCETFDPLLAALEEEAESDEDYVSNAAHKHAIGAGFCRVFHVIGFWLGHLEL
ncbi:hypothetical protein NKJ64_18060 [Mesorhizobium sp. M0062]|uniref:hypothetical protein n=1 Tax=Mesorhizobium sp. M0062 TaxID=2956867 RepID=UPI003338EEF0